MEISLQAILEAREKRAQKQTQMLAQYRKTLLCFTMNIAGPEKNSVRITQGFLLGNSLLRERLAQADISVVAHEIYLEDTGCEAFYVLNAQPETVKRLTVEIEDRSSGGRLYDMDVLGPDGSKMDRTALQLPERKCLLCGNSARLCGRSRSHTVQELQEKTTQLLCEALRERISELAVRSLLCELYTTPKPGLVDQRNSGSHRDMDLFTFLSSSAALWNYFRKCAQIGITTRELPATEVFQQLRTAGVQADEDMLRATGGINTHKGAIFTLGLLCGAAGRVAFLPGSKPGDIASVCACMTAGLTERDYHGVTAENAVTVGQRLFALHGITGARGQAEAGFPAVTEIGLRVLEQGVARGLSLNDAGCGALLAILASTTDTNMIARSDLQTQHTVSAQIAKLLQKEPYPGKETLEKLDDWFIQKNLSPGGSADLLAATYFLYFVTR